MQNDSGAKQSGFDLERFVRIQDVSALILEIRPNAREAVIRKSVVGAFMHQNESGCPGFAERFEASFVRIDEREPSVFQGRLEEMCLIDQEFWKPHMATGQCADILFASGCITLTEEVPMSTLPYRLRDRMTEGHQNQRVRLTLRAQGIHLEREAIRALVSDQAWKKWGELEPAVKDKGKRGRPAEWKWNEVKALLAIEASRNPQILTGGVGPIVRFMIDEMRQLHYDQIPDDLGPFYDFAHLFDGLGDVEDPPPS